MIESVLLENFKSHKHTQLKLDSSRLHALVGQNSSGKTSTLQALHYLCWLASAPFKTIFQYERSPEFLITVGSDVLTVTVNGYWGHVNKTDWTASYGWQRTREDNWSPRASWQVVPNDQQQASGWHESLENADYPISRALKHAVHLKLVSSNLSRAAYSDEVTPRVEYDGSGLAPTLDYLRADAPDKFQTLQEMLRRIVPGVRDVLIKRAKVPIRRQRSIEVDGRPIFYEETQEITGQEVFLNMNTGESIPGHALSEGTILTLGLLTVLMTPYQPNLVLLDDLEQGLHPKAQRELVAVFKEIVQDNQNLQIIFSTHSPYIVDELVPSQVHVLSNTSQGFTITRRLDEHPDAEWASHSLTTGEFWDAEGEDWVSEEMMHG